jgi:hypothetical protein
MSFNVTILVGQSKKFKTKYQTSSVTCFESAKFPITASKIPNSKSIQPSLFLFQLFQKLVNFLGLAFTYMRLRLHFALLAQILPTEINEVEEEVGKSFITKTTTTVINY